MDAAPHFACNDKYNRMNSGPTTIKIRRNYFVKLRRILSKPFLYGIAKS